MARVRPLERRLTAFLRPPMSVRKAMAVIVSATVASVIIGGVVIRLLDPADFPNVGTGFWWALQTVTTVGYGDVTPHTVIGRVVGAIIMLESIAFIAIVTAAITSSFVERARREHMAAVSLDDNSRIEQLGAQLAEITQKLDRIQRELQSRGSDGKASP